MNNLSSNYTLFNFLQSPTDYIIIKFIIYLNLNPIIATSLLLFI